MDCRPSTLTMLLAGAVCAVALTAAAQGGAPEGGSVIFSGPGADNAQGMFGNKTSSDKGDGPDASDEVQAPGSFFAKRPAPALPPVFSPDVDRVLQERKSWALMTPEEIMGVATPEKILGITKSGDSSINSLSPENHFLQDQTTSSFATNSMASEGSATHWSWSKDTDNASTGDALRESAFVNFNRPWTPSTTPANNPFSSFNSGFGAGQRMSEDDSEKSKLTQQADLERFRQMLNTGSTMNQPANTTPGYKFIYSSTPEPDAFEKAQLGNNPSGSSLSTVEDDIMKPTGIAPLPGLATEAPKKTEVTPAWAPKPPPWLSSQQPNPFVLAKPKL